MNDKHEMMRTMTTDDDDDDRTCFDAALTQLDEQKHAWEITALYNAAHHHQQIATTKSARPGAV